MILGGDFRVERKLATGGMSEVYLATQMSLNRTVALKIFRHEGTGGDEVLARCDEVARVFTTVEAILQKNGWMLYGQMIPATIKILRADPEKLAQERARARFILIDEFQDCNRGQIELTALLAGEERNIFAVGDAAADGSARCRRRPAARRRAPDRRGPRRRTGDG